MPLKLISKSGNLGREVNNWFTHIMRNPNWSLVSKSVFSVFVAPVLFRKQEIQRYSIKEASITSAVALTGITISCSGAYTSNVKKDTKLPNENRIFCFKRRQLLI